MITKVLSRADDIPTNFNIDDLPNLPSASSVLMCSPEYFDVVDVKNPFMQKYIGKVDRPEAQRQWKELKTVYENLGIRVETVDPLPGCEDMVFCDNPAFVGVTVDGHRICVPSIMKYASRQKEVPAVTEWFKKRRYEIREIAASESYFEGGGDAIWHPERRLIWGGYGSRSDAAVYPMLSDLFAVPVVLLALRGSQFYHLDTCFCPLDSETALVYPSALYESSIALIRRLFKHVIEVAEDEAVNFLACNAAAFGKNVLIQRGAIRTNKQLRNRGFRVLEVDTGEFLKSGGSVYCMKLAVY